MQLDNITAVVTGAASGLGQATARMLSDNGATVFGFDLPSAIEQADATLRIEWIGADVTSESEVSLALERVSSAEQPLRLVVNCAGIAPAQRILHRDGAHDLPTFEKTVAINLTGTFNVLRLAAKLMASEDADGNGQRGVIINTASIAAYEGQIGQIAYAASKGGVVAMTITAARDLARNGIRVNSIAPGIVQTPLLAALGEDVIESLSASVPFPKRLATPKEFATLVRFIAEHDYLNGETIRMDGALRMPPN